MGRSILEVLTISAPGYCPPRRFRYIWSVYCIHLAHSSRDIGLGNLHWCTSMHSCRSCMTMRFLLVFQNINQPDGAQETLPPTYRQAPSSLCCLLPMSAAVVLVIVEAIEVAPEACDVRNQEEDNHDRGFLSSFLSHSVLARRTRKVEEPTRLNVKSRERGSKSWRSRLHSCPVSRAAPSIAAFSLSHIVSSLRGDRNG